MERKYTEMGTHTKKAENGPVTAQMRVEQSQREKFAGANRDKKQEYLKKQAQIKRERRECLQAGMQRDVTGAKLVIEYSDDYEEDYQISMLRENHLQYMLEMEVNGVGNATYFSYNIGGMSSMQTCFEKQKISCRDLKRFLGQFLKAVDMTRRYLLNPDCLWLDPEYIFQQAGKYRFCYVPVLADPLTEQFHRLTEFFVRQIDYTDTECICLAHKLNQKSMEDQYDVGTLLKQYKQEAAVRRAKAVRNEKTDRRMREENLFSLQEESKETNENVWIPPDEDTETIREMGGFQNLVQRAMCRIKKKRWGKWQDLILESDGPESEHSGQELKHIL